MKRKKILLISLILLTLLLSVSLVSAFSLDFLNWGSELKKTTLQCFDDSSEDRGAMKFRILTGGSDDIQSYYDNITVYVNITDENNHTESFNISEWTNDTFDKSIMYDFYPIDFGTYNVSMYFPGNDIFNSSHMKETVVIEPYVKPVVPNSTDDSSSDLDDESEDNESTTYGVYKDEREEKVSSKSGSGYGYWVYV